MFFSLNSFNASSFCRHLSRTSLKTAVIRVLSGTFHLFASKQHQSVFFRVPFMYLPQNNINLCSFRYHSCTCFKTTSICVLSGTIHVFASKQLQSVFFPVPFMYLPQNNFNLCSFKYHSCTCLKTTSNCVTF
jgi:hypothetical protein